MAKEEPTTTPAPDELIPGVIASVKKSKEEKS